MTTTPSAASPSPVPPSEPPAPAQPQRPARRWLRRLGWGVAAVAALLLCAAAALWWALGHAASLAWVLERAPAYLPAGQQLESRDVQGSLRAGGRIGWLRWRSATLQVEVQDALVTWRLRPLVLHQRLQLGEVSATSVRLTPLADPDSPPPQPLQPLQALPLPLHIELPLLRVQEMTWASAAPVVVRQLHANYLYNGVEHFVGLERVELAQGRYSAHATLQAAAPMALEATLQGVVETPHPATGERLRIGAEVQLQGQLSTAQARLEVQAQLQNTPAPELAASAPDAKAPATPDPLAGVQAQLQATIAPWATQPLLQAQAELAQIDLAALWPQAPATQLSGRFSVKPQGEEGAPGTPAWQLQAQLKNALPGPWDAQRLPLQALQAELRFDGVDWQLDQAEARVGGEGEGRITAQGRYSPASQLLQGTVDVQQLRPSALHSALDRQAVQGRLQAQHSSDGAVQFVVDLRGERGERPPAMAPVAEGGSAMVGLRIDQVSAQGRWQAPLLHVQQLQVQALQARLQAQQLKLDTATLAAEGVLQLELPGTRAQWQGRLGPREGQGQLQVQLDEPQRTHDWWDGLPGQVALLPQWRLRGQAQLDARWTGGWQGLQRQLQQAGWLAASATAPQAKVPAMALQAQLRVPQWSMAPVAAAGPRAQEAAALQLRDVRLQWQGDVAQWQLELQGLLRSGTHEVQTQAHVDGASQGAGAWALTLARWQTQWRDSTHPGPWAAQLPQPVALTLRHSARSGLALQLEPGQLHVSSPLPGRAQLQWEATQWSQPPQGGPMRLRTRGALRELPLAWVDALDSATPSGAEKRLERLGLATDVVLEGAWEVDADPSSPVQARASLRRARGELRLLTGSATGATTVRSSGQGRGAGRAQPDTPVGTPAGLRQAEVQLQLQGHALQASLQWDSERAGRIQAQGSSRLDYPDGQWQAAQWVADAPLAAQLEAQLPDVAVWSALAPPGWRIKGTLQAQMVLSGSRAQPRWHGSLAADGLALRSVLDGVDLQDGRLRATLQGNQLTIDEFRLAGGRGNAARILGRSGNRTEAPVSGGQLRASGVLRWSDAPVQSAAASAQTAAGPEIAMELQAELEQLQVQVRADRQISVSGPLRAQLEQGQLTLRGELTTDRATIILPDSGAPQLGADVVVRKGGAVAGADTGAQSGASGPTLRAGRLPDVAVTLNLGDDFAIQGLGLTSRLTGTLHITSNAATQGQPRVVGEVTTDDGRYRAWGQALDVEKGLVRFSGPYDNPQLDILAIRPNISVRAGVQVSGSAQAPRVRLYSSPELPDAEKLSWVVLGHSAASGGSETALLQQAALSVLGKRTGGDDGLTRNLGLDEIGLKGPRQGEDASAAALTLGKRLSSAMYVTYEYSLSGTLGTLYIFYDLTRNLTLRGQTGMVNALDVVYTLRHD